MTWQGFKPTITIIKVSMLTITPPVWLIQDKIMYKGNVMVNKSLIEKSWLTNLHNHLLPESIHYTIWIINGLTHLQDCLKNKISHKKLESELSIPGLTHLQDCLKTKSQITNWNLIYQWANSPAGLSRNKISHRLHISSDIFNNFNWSR